MHLRVFARRAVRALLSLTAACSLASCAAGGQPIQARVQSQPVASLPLYDVRAEIGDADLRPGDSVKIEHVLCTADTMRPGEICIVRGTYTLASRDAADLSFYITATKGSGISDVDRRQILSVKRGSGMFELRHVLSEGWPHLSFYAGGGSIGGPYFGQGESLLKVMPWKKT
jgi:hypothetical protein